MCTLTYTVFIYVSSESLSKEKLKALVQFKCLRALSDPGEGLGLLAAQVSNGC